MLADEYQCVSAILAHIINKRTVFSITQEVISEYFGLNVPKDYNGTISNIEITDDKSRYGVIIKENGINEMFSRMGLPLAEEYIPIKNIAEYEFEKVLRRYLELDVDIICGYSYGILHKDDNSIDFGHISEIIKVDDIKVTVLDPGPKEAGVHHVNIFDLYSAIRYKSDGLWIISRVDTL